MPAYYRNNWDRLPDYIKNFWHYRARKRQEQLDAVQKAKDDKRKEQDRIKALRKPPAKVWRIGNTVFWEPPDTADQLKPAGYWLSEERHGEWTKHGDYVLPDRRSATTFGDGPARVEVYYNDTALGEVYYSPIVYNEDESYLVDKVRYYVSEKLWQRSTAGVNRWRRVLAAFGVEKPKWVRGRRITPLEPAMTADEAAGYATKGWIRWIPVAKALKRIEKIQNG